MGEKVSPESGSSEDSRPSASARLLMASAIPESDPAVTSSEPVFDSGLILVVDAVAVRIGPAGVWIISGDAVVYAVVIGIDKGIVSYRRCRLHRYPAHRSDPCRRYP